MGNEWLTQAKLLFSKVCFLKNQILAYCHEHITRICRKCHRSTREFSFSRLRTIVTRSLACCVSFFYHSWHCLVDFFWNDGVVDSHLGLCGWGCVGWCEVKVMLRRKLTLKLKLNIHPTVTLSICSLSSPGPSRLF